MKKITNLTSSKMLMGFIMIQPIIDLLTGLMERFGFPLTIGVVSRGVFVLMAVYYLVFMYQGRMKKWIIGYLMLFCVFAFFHLVMNFDISFNSYLFSELKYLIKIIYLPMLAVTGIIILQKSKLESNLFISTLMYVVFIYGAVIFLAQITGTQFLSYSLDKIGHVGWFFAANEIGAIIAILSPFPLIHMLQHGMKLNNVLATLLVLFSGVMIGTKVAYLGVAIILFSIICFMVIYTIQKKVSFQKYVRWLIPLLLVSFIYILPQTPVAHNTNLQASWSGSSVMDLLTGSDDVDGGTTQQDVVDNLIFSSRDKYLQQTKALFKEQPIFHQMFGLGFKTEVKDQLEIKASIEMDYADLYYNFGFIGMLLFTVPFLYVAYLGFAVLFTTKKLWFVFEMSIFPYLVGLVLALAIAFISGHVLLAPSVANYVIVFLLAIFIGLKEQVS